jgi:hypothetical protein
MPVIHMAWIGFKDGVPADRIAQHLAACRALVGRVPVILDLKAGASFSDRAGSLTHCVLVTLPDRVSLPHYLNHPQHLAVLGALKPDVAEMRAMDIEV